MQIHDLEQGSPEWLAYRAKYFNASDAPAMMGVSPYKTRAQLVRELATGIGEEHDAAKLALFADGHRTEDLARTLAENIVGEPLYRVVASEGRLSASFDGLTMAGQTAWEHKMLNNDIRAALDDPDATGADLPMVYQIQMEQQAMICRCDDVLFTATKFSPAGQLIEERHCWYTPNPELAAKIEAGWDQLAIDVANYKAEDDVAEVKPVARAIEALPALLVQVEGRVVTTNLKEFRAAAAAFIEGIKTDLQTDQDFADAEKTVKFCEDGEKRLELVKQQALSQTATIDELFRTIDGIREDLRGKRLALSKLVDQRKVSIRTEIAAKAQADIDAHWAAVSARLGESWIKRACPDFGGAMKGKKTVTSCRAAVDQALADAKIQMTQLADRLAANRATLKRDDTDWMFLFADFSTVGAKAPEDFRAVAELRIRDHQSEQQKKEAAAAAAEAAQAQAQAQAPVAQPAPAAPTVMAFARRSADPVAEEKPTLNLRTINDRLAVVTVSEQSLASLGFTATVERGARLYRESDWPAMCRAISARVLQAATVGELEPA